MKLVKSELTADKRVLIYDVEIEQPNGQVQTQHNLIEVSQIENRVKNVNKILANAQEQVNIWNDISKAANVKV